MVTDAIEQINPERWYNVSPGGGEERLHFEWSGSLSRRHLTKDKKVLRE